MKSTKFLLSTLFAASVTLSFSACSTTNPTNTATANTVNQSNAAVVVNSNQTAVNSTVPVSNTAANNTAPASNTASGEKKDFFPLISKDKEISDYLKDSKGGAAALAKTMTVKNTDLNSDGQPEYIVVLMDDQLCGAHGNCPNWVYRKTGDDYQLLLRTSGESLSAEKTSTNKFSDLRSEGSNTAVETGVTIYKFDGTKYQAKECFNEVADEKGGKPKTVPQKCEEGN